MKNAHSIVLKILGILLLTAAILKGWQLLTEPLANKDIWSYRPLLIFTVEFELALALWLLSGLFKKAAWLATVAVFSVFSLITLYKALSGADSCGCFGAVKVNPWITLLLIDLPAVIALLIFRCGAAALGSDSLRRSRIIPSLPRYPQISGGFAAYLVTLVLVLAVTTSVLALNKPANVTSSYEVLEPETWIGKRLPILDYIDIGKQLETGNWLVLFYHYDCPDCQKAISEYEQLACNNTDNKDFPQIAFIEVPPYDQGRISTNSSCVVGRLSNTKEWFIATPIAIFGIDGKTICVKDNFSPDSDTVLSTFSMTDKCKVF